MRRTLLLASCSLWLTMPALADEPFLPGELVETVDADTLLVRCQGRGESLEAAALHARLGCLRWYAEGLTGTPAEEAALGKLWPALGKELDALVEPARGGSRDGRGSGLRSKRTLADGRVAVTLSTRLHASRLKRRLEAGGALAPLPAGGGRSVVVIPAPGAKRPALWFLVKAELIPFLQKSGLEVLEEPEPGRPAGAELVLRVAVTREDEGAGGGAAFAYTVALELVEAGSGKVVASGVAQGQRRPAGLAAEESRGLREAVVGAAGALQPRLEAHVRGGAGGAGR